MRNIWKFYPVVIIVGIFLFFYFKGKNNRAKFYNNKINQKIISSNDWQKRTIAYYLEGGSHINISVLDSLDLQVGDSISKGMNTGKFDVYRKQGDHYVFYKNYTIER